MIAAIVILVIGVLLIVAAVLLRKKLGNAWLCSVAAAGVLVAICGGWFCYGQYQQTQQNRESLYLGLRYLEQMQLESANYHLKKVDTSDSYVSAAARSLLEIMRGNELTARLNLDIAATQVTTSEQETLLAALRGFSPSDHTQLSTLINQLLHQVGLPERQQESMDLYVQVESGWYGGNIEQLQELGLNENDAGRLNVSALLSNGSYEAATAAAVQLADNHPSEENRLLLAGTIAESSYRGVTLSSWTFARAREGGVTEDASVQREREALQAQQQQAEAELSMLDLTLAGTTDEAKVQALNQQRLELTQEIQSLQRRIEKLYVYRAFNAIADLHSLNAKLVRARLYFALLDYDKAVETLLDAADSWQVRLSLDQNLKNSLQIVANAYNDDNVFYENAEFRDAMTKLLAAPFADLMYFSQSSLTHDFVQRIVSDQKSYGRSLAVSGLDVRDYPIIRVTLSGRADILREVVQQQKITARDTRQNITYTAELIDGTTADICMLLDRSGSMGGEPIQNLRTAVADFIADMEAGTSLSLVAFDSSAQRLTDLTQDSASLLMAADSLSAGGGTEITTAIREGLSVLQEAGSNRVMLLMTDGQSNIDFGVVDDAAAEGITIHTIGFGSVNDTLLQEIADRTGGQYVRADSSAELSNVYASLQQIIGNVVTIEYTVTNPEIHQQRYFFLEVMGHTVHRNYALTASISDATQVYTSNPYFVTPGQLQRMAERGDVLEVELTGTKLSQVQAVTIGGRPATIMYQGNSRLRLSVAPSLTAGWQGIELQLAGGSAVSLEHLLLVGQTATYRNVRLGSLLIPNAQGVLPGDGTLVLAGTGISIREYLTDGAESSLDLSFSGTLILPWTLSIPADGAETPPNMGVDLGDQGVIYGFGVVTIGRSDSAYVQTAPTTVASGEIIFTCGPKQSQMSMAAETGVR